MAQASSECQQSRRLTDSTIGPPKTSDFLQHTFNGCSAQENMQLKTKYTYISLCAKA